jgi:hypothetical protein
VDADIKAPHVLATKNLFSSGFLFPWGQRKSKTEAILISKSSYVEFINSDFSVKGYQSDSNFLEVMKNPFMNFISARDSKVWKTLKR